MFRQAGREAKSRQERIALLDVLEQRVKQFRRDDDIWPFRRPHEPIDFSTLIATASGDLSTPSAVDAVRARTVIRMDWDEGDLWEAWVAMLPSGIHVYFDTDGDEHRLLASVKRGSAMEADRFFLELLAESRGHQFGIEMGGRPPARVRTLIDDRAFLTDVFVDLFEGTDAEADIRALSNNGSASGDFQIDVERWLTSVLVAPLPMRSKRYPRRRDAMSDL